MVRWSYVLPRVLIVALIAAFLAFGFDPLLHWGIERAGTRVLGAKVELESVRTSLRGARMKVRGVRAADPGSPMKNLFEAEQVLLDLDAEALLLRRLVVDQGRISGLRLNTERSESGAVAERPAASGMKLPLPAFDAASFEQMADRAVEELMDQSEAVAQIRSAEQRWIDRYRSWKGRIQALQSGAKSLKSKYGNIDLGGKDPLQIATLANELSSEVQAMQQELTSLQQEIGNIPSDVETEFAGVQAARDRDMGRLREKIRVDELNAGRLAEFLLRPELEKRTREVLQWVENGRALSDKVSAPERAEVSQEVITFSELPERPSYLIRELLVDGMLQIDRQPVPFAAVARDIASPPSLHGEPATLRIRTTGGIRAEIDGRLDYRGEVATQTYTVRCPRIAMPAKTLGKPDEFAVRTAPGHVAMSAEMTFVENTVRGQIDLRQSETSLEPMVADRYGARIRESLSSSLSNIHEIQAEIHLAGDWRAPKVEIVSDLGDVVAEAVRSAVDEEVAHQQQRISGRLDDKISQQRKKFDSMLAERKQDLLRSLNVNEQQLRELLNLGPRLDVGGLNLPAGLNFNRFLPR